MVVILLAEINGQLFMSFLSVKARSADRLGYKLPLGIMSNVDAANEQHLTY